MVAILPQVTCPGRRAGVSSPRMRSSERRVPTALAALSACLLAACTAPEGTACTSDAQCAASEECVDERCRPRGDAGRQDAGACGAGCECVVDSECPPVAACAQSACESNRCVVTAIDARCAPVGRCDPERGCVPFEDAGSPMDAGEPPPDGGAVTTDAGTDAGPRPPQIGDACASNADCRAISGTAECMTRNRLGTTTFPGGYCSQRCGSAACPAGSVCLREFLDGYCVRPCASDTECRASEGYECRAPSRGTLEDAAAACLPPSA